MSKIVMGLYWSGNTTNPIVRHETAISTLGRISHIIFLPGVFKDNKRFASDFPTFLSTRRPYTIYILVGGFNPSEKYESQLGLLFPIYGKIIQMFQTTNQCVYIYICVCVHTCKYNVPTWWLVHLPIFVGTKYLHQPPPIKPSQRNLPSFVKNISFGLHVSRVVLRGCHPTIQSSPPPPPLVSATSALPPRCPICGVARPTAAASARGPARPETISLYIYIYTYISSMVCVYVRRKFRSQSSDYMDR